MQNQDDNLRRLDQSQAARRSTLSEWRAGRVHEHTLPSGLVVKLRDVTMTDLLLTGRLPQQVFDLVQEVSTNGSQEFDLKLLSQNAAEFHQMLNVLTEISLVEPRISDVSDDEHITLAELPADDKMEIFNFINREVEAVRSFREGEVEPSQAV